MPYRCKNWSGDYDGMVYQSWTEASKRADQLEKMYGGTWFSTEVTDTSNNASSSDPTDFVTLLKFIFLFFIIAPIYSCYDETIGRRKEINNVTHYCSQEQLPKTGKQACIDAKKTVINRLRGDLNRANKTLKETRRKTPKLLQNKNKKCTKSGLELYGTEGCADAKSSLEENYQEIEGLKSKIKTYQFDIDKYKRFAVNGSHIVDTNILNLRSCANTNCRIVAKLSLGEGVWLREVNGEWAKIRSEKGDGFVANKFLMVNEDKKSHNPNKKSDDNLCGIGVTVKMENGIVKITSVLDGGGAQKAGIKPDDFITKIDNKPVIEMLLSEAIAKMKGKPGTSVELQVIRQDEKPFVVKLKREIIKKPSETKEENEEESNLWLFTIILSVVGIYAIIKIYKAYTKYDMNTDDMDFENDQDLDEVKSDDELDPDWEDDEQSEELVTTPRKHQKHKKTSQRRSRNIDLG